MPLLINFKDAVNASVLDPNALDAVFYMDGDFENEIAVRRQCPHARLFAITTRGATGHGIFACDSETGDLTVAETEAWVVEQVRLDVKLIVVYANQDRWLNQGLLAALAKYGDRIERWDADFDGNPTIPSWASAKQYATGNVDLDSARASFFSGVTPVDLPHGTAHFAGTYNLATGKWTIHGMPGLDVHFAGPKWQASAEIQLQIGEPEGGHWRAQGIALNSKPLGD